MNKLRLRKWFQLLAYVCITSVALGFLMSMAVAYSPEVPSELGLSRMGSFLGRIVDLPNLIGSRNLAAYDEKTRTIMLAVNESVELERIRITYRGLADRSTFKVETIIPNFDREMFFRHEFDTDVAKQGFRLYRDEFELIVAKADRLKLRLVSNYRQ